MIIAPSSAQGIPCIRLWTDIPHVSNEVLVRRASFPRVADAFTLSVGASYSDRANHNSRSSGSRLFGGVERGLSERHAVGVLAFETQSVVLILGLYSQLPPKRWRSALLQHES